MFILIILCIAYASKIFPYQLNIPLYTLHASCEMLQIKIALLKAFQPPPLNLGRVSTQKAFK